MICITFPCGVRHAKADVYVNGSLFQSTHPHRVRLARFDQYQAIITFNPRTHTGCDNISTRKRRTRNTFQSTHPHRVRRVSSTSSGTAVNHLSIHAPTQGATINLAKCLPEEGTFNPRTHTGCDKGDIIGFSRKNLSIHAPTQGATRNVWQSRKLT